MSQAVEAAYTCVEVEVPIWGGRVTIVLTSDGRVFYPLRALCVVLGLAPQMQTDRLRGSRVYRRYVAQYRVPTKRGQREAWHIERRALGLWLGSVQDSYLRDEVAEGIIQYQEALMGVADELLADMLNVERAPTIVALPERRVVNVERFALSLADQIGRLQERVTDLESAGDDGEERP